MKSSNRQENASKQTDRGYAPITFDRKKHLDGAFDTKDIQNHSDKGTHTPGSSGTFFEGAENQMRWSHHLEEL